MLKKGVIFLFVLILSGGCLKSGLNVDVRFDQARGIKAKDRVIFEGNPIGVVEKMTYTEAGDYLVSIHIDSNFTNAATDYAKFYIIEDPGRDQAKAIEVQLTAKGGTVLADGSKVDGSVKPSPAADLLNKLSIGMGIGMKALGDQMGDWREKFDAFTKDLESIPDSEAYKQLEKEFDRLVTEMKNSSAEVQKKIETDILPRLKEEMDKIQKRLEEAKPKTPPSTPQNET